MFKILYFLTSIWMLKISNIYANKNNRFNFFFKTLNQNKNFILKLVRDIANLNMQMQTHSNSYFDFHLKHLNFFIYVQASLVTTGYKFSF